MLPSASPKSSFLPQISASRGELGLIRSGTPPYPRPERSARDSPREPPSLKGGSPNDVVSIPQRIHLGRDQRSGISRRSRRGEQPDQDRRARLQRDRRRKRGRGDRRERAIPDAGLGGGA